MDESPRPRLTEAAGRRPWASPSLRTQLYVWLLLPMSILVLVSSLMAWSNAVSAAREVFDRMLLGSARMIGESIDEEDGRLHAELPPAALENLQTGESDLVYYRVDAVAEGLLTGTSQFPRASAALALAPEAWTSFDTNFRGDTVRTVAFAQPVYPFGPHDVVIVQVATTRKGLDRLTWHVWSRSVGAQALLLTAVAIFGWLWVGVALAPLRAIGEDVRHRELESTRRIDARRVPAELRPLVRAINGYVRRIGHYVNERSRFISNAAHQLKTPITVLNTQVTVGLRSNDAAQKQQALQGAHETVQHCIRLIHQLLALSSAEHQHFVASPPVVVDMGDVARGVLEDLAELADAKRIDLGLAEVASGADDAGSAEAAAPYHVRGLRLMVHEMLSNIVHNAIQYAPEGGAVTVSLGADEHHVLIHVDDTGPGIAVEERERVFERFYRLRDIEYREGTGLGLAIVREIARTLGAEVRLEDKPDASAGLRVTVRMPRVDEPAGPA